MYTAGDVAVVIELKRLFYYGIGCLLLGEATIVWVSLGVSIMLINRVFLTTNNGESPLRLESIHLSLVQVQIVHLQLEEVGVLMHLVIVHGKL